MQIHDYDIIPVAVYLLPSLFYFQKTSHVFVV